MSRRVRLEGTVQVDAPVEEAFALFTPSGERRWSAGWDPWFPDPAHEDETRPGTVFHTVHSGPVTWVVAACDPPSRIAYAQVSEAGRAGLVEVICRAGGRGGTVAQVSYDMTALTDEAAGDLRGFAAGYREYLEHWQHAIAAALAA